MVTRLQHVGLIVSDLERSRRFYRDALGLEEVARPSNFTFTGTWFRFGDTELHLLVEADTTSRAGAPDQGRSAAYGLCSHVALEVEDLDTGLARLREHGVAVIGGPMPRGDGVTQVFFQDPDGHVLELFQWTGEDQRDAPPRAPVRG